MGHDGIPVGCTMGTTTALSRQAVINGAVIKPGKHPPGLMGFGGMGFRAVGEGEGELEGWPVPLFRQSRRLLAAFFHFIKPRLISLASP